MARRLADLEKTGERFAFAFVKSEHVPNRIPKIHKIFFLAAVLMAWPWPNRTGSALVAQEPAFIPLAKENSTAEIDYQYKDYYQLIGRKEALPTSLKNQKPLIGIISHHLPTASPLIDNFYSRLAKTRPDIKTFVVVGPDHSEKCRLKFVTTGLGINTMFGLLSADKKLYEGLLKAGAKEEDGCFYGEHSIGVQANYIKKYFPEAKIVPLLLSYSAKDKDFTKLVEALKGSREDIFVLASLDFSHYVDVDRSEARDALTRKAILKLDSSSIGLKQVDSPGTLRLILELAKAMKLKPEIIEHKNSFEYDGSYSNTTSYFSVFF